MKINTINEIPYTDKIGIIINVSTKYVTSLALLSSIKWLNIPILLIDCESTDNSYEYFEKLNQSHEFYLTRLPLKKHGFTLDYIFQNINAKYLYLIDSDTEIINDDIIHLIDKFIPFDNVFGAGFEHSASWLDRNFLSFRYGYYAERMWIPFTCLNIEKIREALNNKKSFIDTCIFNDFPLIPIISRVLMKRFKLPLFNRFRLKILNPFKNTYYGEKPSYIFYDTGAKIHEYLKHKKGYYFVGIPAHFHETSVLHYHGITRRILAPNDENSTVISDYGKIIEKLKNLYKIEDVEPIL